jgi:riboflavin transporter FmnP
MAIHSAFPIFISQIYQIAMTIRITILWSILITPLYSMAQQEGVDTTSRGYQVGYEIGSWLPFIIIFALALMVIIRSYRLSQRNNIPD